MQNTFRAEQAQRGGLHQRYHQAAHSWDTRGVVLTAGHAALLRPRRGRQREPLDHRAGCGQSARLGAIAGSAARATRGSRCRWWARAGTATPCRRASRSATTAARSCCWARRLASCAQLERTGRSGRTTGYRVGWPRDHTSGTMLRDGSGARWTPGTTAAQAVALVGGDAQPNALRLGRRWQGPSTPGIFAALLGTVMLDDVVRAGAGAERGFQAISTSGGGISRSVSRSAIWLGVEGAGGAAADQHGLRRAQADRPGSWSAAPAVRHRSAAERLREPHGPQLAH